MIDLKNIDTNILIAAAIGFVAGFLVSKISGGIVKWIVIVAVVAALGYLFYIKI